jgi:RyR domain
VDEGTFEQIAERVHDAWIRTKQTQGVTSWLSDTGEEQMVPYAKLSERAKDLDRASVRAVLEAIVDFGGEVRLP